MTRKPRLLCLAFLLLLAPPIQAEPLPPPCPDCCPDGDVQPCEGPVVSTLTLNAAGVFTNPNPVGHQVPDGAWREGYNVVIDRPGVARPRRGEKQLAFIDPSTGANGLSQFHYSDALLLWSNQSRLHRRTSGAFSLVNGESGTPAVVSGPVQGGRVRGAHASGKLYLTTGQGLMEMDGPSSALRRAGAPRALDFYDGRLAMNTTGGHLPAGAVTGYRAVWGFNDSQGRPILGEPSGRIIIKNYAFQATLSRTSNVVTADINPSAFRPDAFPFPGFEVIVTPTDINNPAPSRKVLLSASAATIAYSEAGGDFAATGGYTVAFPAQGTVLHVPIPEGVRAGHFLQIYRTPAIVSPLDDPGDNMGLVAEIIVTEDHLIAGQIQVTDMVPDLMRGTPLYTNPLQQGGLQGNARAPLARDLTVFKDSMFLANTMGPHRLTLRFLGLPDDGDVLTIAGESYTARVNVVSITEYKLFTDADLTVSQQIEATARALVARIAAAHPTITAHYASGDGDPPGVISLEAKVIDNQAFTAVSSARGERFAPELVSAISSRQDVVRNRLHYSKTGLHYAFPLSNTLPVGAEDSEILRVLALRDSLFVFKRGVGEGRGLWRVTGTGPGYFRADPFNLSVDLIAPETAVVIDNQILALTANGFVAVSEAGVDTIGIQVEDQIAKMLREVSKETLETVAHAAAYETGTEQKFMVWVPLSSSATVPTMAWVYNLATDTWTQRNDTPTCSGLSPAGKLITCHDGQVFVERKTGHQSDYMGPLVEEGSVSAVGFDGRSIVTNAPYLLEPGMALWSMDAGEESAVKVMTVNEITGLVTLSGPFGGGAEWGAAYPIRTNVRWVVNSAGDPSAAKQFTEVSLLLENTNTHDWKFSFASDLMSETEDEVEAEASADGTPYVRLEVPWEVQRTTRLSVRVEYNAAAEFLDIVGLQAVHTIFPGVMER